MYTVPDHQNRPCGSCRAGIGGFGTDSIWAFILVKSVFELCIGAAVNRDSTSENPDLKKKNIETFDLQLHITTEGFSSYAPYTHSPHGHTSWATQMIKPPKQCLHEFRVFISTTNRSSLSATPLHSTPLKTLSLHPLPSSSIHSLTHSPTRPSIHPSTLKR